MFRDGAVTLWRVVLFWAIAFWQGGFLFYTSAVVPNAALEIGHTQQGFITRHVTVWLNGASVVSLVLLAIELLATSDARRVRRVALWTMWLGMAGCQVGLFAMHPAMRALMDEESMSVGRGFYSMHRVYLWTHTVQWGLMLVATVLLLGSWREGDRRRMGDA